MYKKTDEIFVRIAKHGYIPYIGICGPIPNPIKVSTETCLKLVNAGIVVHQFDPATKETIQLTRTNVFDDKKFDRKKAAQKPAVTPPPVAPEKPVEPVVFTGVQKQDEQLPINHGDTGATNEADALTKFGLNDKTEDVAEGPTVEQKEEEATEDKKVENGVNKFNNRKNKVK